MQLVDPAIRHIERASISDRRNQGDGKKVFIGHGQSLVWRELKDFIQDRLKLEWEEFNRIPTAGMVTVERLSEMLDNAAFAFLILTAEDEQADRKMHARMNVVHEVGLFQGRLGFDKAIVLLEDGCEEFSNIHGLGHIRFTKGNIKAAFEEIGKFLKTATSSLRDQKLLLSSGNSRIETFLSFSQKGEFS